MFIRSKVVDGQTYYQVVRTYRDRGRVRQQTLASLGKHPTIEEVRDQALEEYLRWHSNGLFNPWAWDKVLSLDDLARRWHAQQGTDYQEDARLEEHRKMRRRREARAAQQKARGQARAHDERLYHDLKTLGLAPTARQLKDAYRRQSRKCHPDHGGSDEAMTEVNAAYERLMAILGA
jgi:hypothetical protein